MDFVQAVANLTNITEEVPELSDELIDNNSAVQSAHPTDQAYLVEEMSGPEELNDSSNLPSDIQEDKSSSFPFGTLQSDLTALYDQSSTGGLNDAAANTTDSIETLLANLTEDNANSLPSDGGSFSQQIAYEPNEATSENSSLPAFAEDLANGNSSSDTKNDALEAEMVSEDELPAPAVSKIDDAEEVSDEELPGPKLAELPADTEVVSEDELPASIKAKRGYDPASPTDGDDPETKKARLDDAGNTNEPFIQGRKYDFPILYRFQMSQRIKKNKRLTLMMRRKIPLNLTNIGKLSMMIQPILPLGLIYYNMWIKR